MLLFQNKITRKLKISLLSLFVLSLALTGASSVSAENTTYNVDTVVDLSSPDINLTILSGSVATSVVADTGSVIATVPASNIFTITASGRALTTSGENGFGIVTTTCTNAGLQTLKITATAGSAQTVTITPMDYQCVVYGGGGGGGSSSSTPSTPAIPVTPAPTEVVPVIVTPVTPVVVPIVAPTTPSQTQYALGTKVLKLGSKGDAVKELQRFLNDKLKLGLVIDGRLGAKTIAVIKKWQKSQGLDPDGLIGPDTKAMMNADTTTTSTPSTSTGSYNLGTAILKNGSRGDAVKELQRFLNDKLDLGLVVDGMLGPNTITVIKEWQKSQGLDPDGLIGPNTKAMMNAEAN